MTVDEQLALWRRGVNTHNPERDECCPDFSCCQPELARPLAERETFCQSDKEKQLELMSQYLGALIVHAGVSARIVGQEEGDGHSIS